MALLGSEVLQHSPIGAHRMPYGSFAGKTEQSNTITLEIDTEYEVYIRGRNGNWDHTVIVFSGTDFGGLKP